MDMASGGAVTRARDEGRRAPRWLPALGALNATWAEWYDIGCDEAGGWWRRKDGLGGVRYVREPDEADRDIAADYALRPVWLAPGPGHTPTPKPGTVYTVTSLPADVDDPRDYPAEAVCRCGRPARCAAPGEEWEHFSRDETCAGCP